MGDVLRGEAPDDVRDRVDLADVREETVAEPLALAGSFDEPRDIDETDRRGHAAPAFGQVGIVQKTSLGHGNIAYNRIIGFGPHHVAGGIVPLAHFVEVVAGQLVGYRAQLGQLAQRGLVSQRQLVGAHPCVLVG